MIVTVIPAPAIDWMIEVNSFGRGYVNRPVCSRRKPSGQPMEEALARVGLISDGPEERLHRRSAPSPRKFETTTTSDHSTATRRHHSLREDSHELRTFTPEGSKCLHS